VEHPEMSVQEVIILAIKREEQAWKRYLELAKSTDNPRIKQLLQRLADEEAKHKLQLETIYDDEGLYEN
jgi:rubrerythrin